MILKTALKRTLSRFGYDLRRTTPRIELERTRLIRLLRHHKIDFVLDVGASEGQFALRLRAAGFTDTIVSFEPLSGAHAELTRRSAEDDQWIIAPRAAIGAVDTVAEINVAGNSVSSSLMPMGRAHEEAAPASRYVGVEEVRVCRLDGLSQDFLPPVDARAFLKVDTQGYEKPVYDGARGLLERVKGLQLELSLVELYEGQESFLEMVSQLQEDGFQLAALSPGFSNFVTGELLQVDAVFFR